MVAAEKRAAAASLEQVRASFKGTAEEKAKLEQQIANLKSEYQTKEEKTAEEYARNQRRLSEEAEQAKKSAETWRGNYTNLMMERDLLAAASADAFNPSLVAQLLMPTGEIIETVDENGVPTGRYETRFKITKISEKDKKPVELKVTAADAVKFMTEQPALYGSLFKSTKVGGAGGSGGASGGKSQSITEVAAGRNPEAIATAYRERMKGQK